MRVKFSVRKSFSAMTVFKLAVLAVSLQNIALKPHAHAETKTDHVVIMVFDQMRPDYIERFNLKNFKRLKKMGRNYPNGIVGHLGAVTVVSHLVLSTGLLPKDLPWMDDVMWDKEGVLGKKDGTYETTHFSQEEELKLLNKMPRDGFLAKKLKDKFEGKVFSIGEKSYAVLGFGSPAADGLIYMGKKAGGNCIPTGVQIPDYISKNNRYEINCKDAAGTEGSIYPLDGNKYYPGTDEKHLGGDVWVADAALDIMNKEKWSGLFLTFGAIDKFGHMLGENDAMVTHSFTTPAHLEDIVRLADAQLGKILDQLEKNKLMGQTMIVVTADHGGQSDFHYLGNGHLAGFIEGDKPSLFPYFISRLLESKMVRTMYSDTGIRLWLKDKSLASKKRILELLEEIPSVTRIVEKEDPEGLPIFREVYKNLKRTDDKFKRWSEKHDLPLANTMAAPHGPDFIAFLENNAGFETPGDHGGAQEAVQRIPMIVYEPNGKKGIDNRELRLVDIEPLIVQALKLDPKK